jgi:TolB-like protein/Flp pilus assembly protein TadD
MDQGEGMYQFGCFQLDLGEHRLVRDGAAVSLQPKAFEILRLLVEHAGRLLTKEELLRRIWPDALVEENNLNKNISLLRKVLAECATGMNYIETVPRVGYRFVAEVSRTAPCASAHTANPYAVTEASPEKSIAVLYFENLSGDKEDEYFRDGMTEDVITELAKIKGLHVFPRSAVLPFRDMPSPIAQAGQQLRAAFVLEGSIRRAGSRLRITARLAETSSGHYLWSERYDRSLEDVFAIQDEIAQNIARALRVMLSDEEKHEIEKVPTRNIQAYDCYLRGRQYFYQLRRQSLEFAHQMFSRAIAIDPGYAQAYAGVADCCSFLYMWFEVKEENLLAALSASAQAVALDPQSAEAHASLGLAEYLSKNYESAREAFEIALELDPELFEAYYFYARSCFAQGQYEKAEALFRRASEASPQDYQAPSLRGLCLRALGRADEALEVLREAFRKAEQHLQLHPDEVRAICLGSCALYDIGDHEHAREWAERALRMHPEEGTVLYNAACTYAKLKETSKAMGCLEKAFRQGFGHKEWLEHDPDLDSLRDHPRYKCLLWELEVGRHCGSIG